MSMNDVWPPVPNEANQSPQGGHVEPGAQMQRVNWNASVNESLVEVFPPLQIRHL
jgi:hypothetical protein